MLIERGLKAAVDIILPRTCAVCGRRLNIDEQNLCLPCLSEIPLTHFWERDHNEMADKFNSLIEDSTCLTDGESERYVFAAALFFYDGKGNYRRITHRLKYHADLKIGRFFGQMLGRKLKTSGHFSDVNAVIPVPLHWARKWKRGYNQAEVIAKEIADLLGIDMQTDILKRVRHTRTQTQVNPKDKAKNVSGAFQVSTGKAGSDHYRHLLLVDDVFTSGNTLFACYKALREVFPPSVRISVATLGFVGE